MQNPSDFQNDHHEPGREIAADDANYIGNILSARLSRRQALLGGVSAATTTILGGLGVSACSSNDTAAVATGITPKLGFTAIAKSLADLVTVPTGYNVDVLWALGDSFASTDPVWSDNGSETEASYDRRAGDHHDGMYYFGLSATGTPDRNASTRGILAMNHEAPNPFNTATGSNGLYVHPAGATTAIVGGVATRTVADEARKEMKHHGVSVIEVTKSGSSWSVVKDSTFNRRVTANTTMDIRGPVRGDSTVFTKFSPTGLQTQGTVNNCAHGYTPWGTYLTCEENWAGYFARSATDNTLRTAAEITSLTCYGNAPDAKQRLNWNTAGTTDEFQRWDTSVKGATSADDFRNVINQFGYVVEIDHYNKTATPAKRTALGRFAHEGAWPALVTAGRPLVWYMGDDQGGDYIYKYVSNQNWNSADASAADRMATGNKYLDDGVLYAAKFNADGTGQWIALVQGSNGLTAGNATFPFTNQAAVSMNSRLAGDVVGATKMDRPEWAAVNPLNGEVYLTLTNNGSRTVTDPANPRRYTGGAAPAGGVPGSGGNVNGHIIRWREDGNDPTATTFRWDIYLFASRAEYTDVAVNASGLDATNDMSAPDGLWFDPRGLLWIQTDDSSAYTSVTNCMMLAASPGTVGDGAAATLAGQGTFKGKNPGTDLRRFMVGPKGCEITGVDITPDGKSMFVNIQHPGEGSPSSFSNPTAYGSNWPGSQFGTAKFGFRPRSATIVITKNDGGIIGV